MPSTIATTEQLLIDTLRADFGARVRTVQSLPGNWDDEMLKQMLLLAPFVLVAFTGGAAPRPGTVLADINAVWEVYVGTAHASGQQARRLGDALQIGTYEMLELVVARLHGFNVPDVATLDLQRVENLFTGTIEGKGLAVYAAVFSLPMSFNADLVLADLDDFETFAAQYDLPPLDDAAAHQDWLAGDNTTTAPDARDTVTLPTTP